MSDIPDFTGVPLQAAAPPSAGGDQAPVERTSVVRPEGFPVFDHYRAEDLVGLDFVQAHWRFPYY